MTGDLRRILKIGEYCESIRKTVSEFSDWCVQHSVPYKAICLDLIQIGEHAGRLSEEFRSQNAEMPWRRIVNFRNLVAHDYDGIEDIYFRPIVQKYVPDLWNFCKGYLQTGAENTPST